MGAREELRVVGDLRPTDRPDGREEELAGGDSLGVPLARREDDELLRGAARFVADLPPADALSMVLVRSTVARGRLRAVDLSAARRLPGVVAALDAADVAGLLAAMSGGAPEAASAGRAGPRPESPKGSEPALGRRADEPAGLARPLLARDWVSFVGEPLAVLVATTAAEASDALEAVVVEIDPEAAVVDPEEARRPGAPAVRLGSPNVVVDSASEDEDPLTDAEVVLKGTLEVPRLAPVPLEPHGSLAVPDSDGRVTLWCSTQSPFAVRREVAGVLGISEATLRVRAPAVGGGFGAKGGTQPEQVLVTLMARWLKRPVRYVERRSENLVAMTHGRGQRLRYALGARSDGTLVGLWVEILADLGASGWRGSFVPMVTRLMASGPYRLGRVGVAVQGVLTSRTPTGPYRGAGRPEATLLLERAIDRLALRLGEDPAELRLKNLLRPEELPHRTPTGASYDRADYPAVLRRALELAGYADLRRQASLNCGERLRGVGVACGIEVSGSGGEWGAVEVTPDGEVVARSGSSPHGQGHETVFAQVVAQVLRVDPARVRVVHSDTDTVARGVGTFGSRSGQLGGSALHLAARAVKEEALRVAAGLLEADPADLRLSPAGLHVAGVPSRAVTWAACARRAEEIGTPLAAERDATQPEGTYSFGAAVATVEVDRLTGRVTPLSLLAVDDCGTVLNPLVVEGQVHGGLAQGVGQALYEEVVYDREGNPLTTTLADYGIPSAPDLPAFATDTLSTPSDRNPLGARGVGESGAVIATPAVLNALVDALRPLGVDDVGLPATPERVWQSIEEASARRNAPGETLAGPGNRAG